MYPLPYRKLSSWIRLHVTFVVLLLSSLSQALPVHVNEVNKRDLVMAYIIFHLSKEQRNRGNAVTHPQYHERRKKKELAVRLRYAFSHH